MGRDREATAALAAASLRLAVGSLFAVSGVLKVLHPDTFARALGSYGLFSGAVITVLGGVLPPIEIALGVLFAAGAWVPLLARGLVGLLALGTFAVAAGLALGGAVDCGCFPVGGESKSVGAWFFLRNAALIAATIWVAERSGAVRRPQPASRDEPPETLC